MSSNDGRPKQDEDEESSNNADGGLRPQQELLLAQLQQHRQDPTYNLLLQAQLNARTHIDLRSMIPRREPAFSNDGLAEALLAQYHQQQQQQQQLERMLGISSSQALGMGNPMLGQSSLPLALGSNPLGLPAQYPSLLDQLQIQQQLQEARRLEQQQSLLLRLSQEGAAGLAGFPRVNRPQDRAANMGGTEGDPQPGSAALPAVRAEDGKVAAPAAASRGPILDNEPFPARLYRMITETEDRGMSDIVSFTPSGKAFRVHNRKVFLGDILPQYSRIVKYSSFKRQLYLYDFQFVRGGPDDGAYFHPLFVKGKPEQLNKIKRVARGYVERTIAGARAQGMNPDEAVDDEDDGAEAPLDESKNDASLADQDQKPHHSDPQERKRPAE